MTIELFSCFELWLCSVFAKGLSVSTCVQAAAAGTVGPGCAVLQSGFWGQGFEVSPQWQYESDFQSQHSLRSPNPHQSETPWAPPCLRAGKGGRQGDNSENPATSEAASEEETGSECSLIIVTFSVDGSRWHTWWTAVPEWAACPGTALCHWPAHMPRFPDCRYLISLHSHEDPSSQKETQKSIIMSHEAICLQFMLVLTLTRPFN